MNKKGFTIVEMLIVIVIIGILASITVVSYTHVIETKEDQESALQKECEKYNVIPEEHVDLVPTVCVTEYFKDKEHER